MIFNLLQADTLAEAITPTQMNESLFSMFTMGGPLMWVLLALSILAI